MKKNIFILAIIISSALFFYFHNTSAEPNNFSLDGDVFTQCETSKDRVAAYDCYKNVALYALENGWGVDELAQYASGSNAHAKEHSVGRAMLIASNYDLYKAIKRCAPDCRNPYYHAFAQEWGKHAPLRLEEFIDFLKNHCSLQKEIKKALGCYHNVGHFYAASDKNLGNSLSICDELEDNNNFFHCANGAVHEQFFQSNGENLFGLCSNYSGRIRNVCFGIGSSLYPRWIGHTVDDEGLLKLCDKTAREIPIELNNCYSSAAWIIEQRDGAVNLSWCDNLDSKFKDLCVNQLKSPKVFGDVFGCVMSEDLKGAVFSCEI